MTAPASLAEALAQLQAQLPHVAKGQRARVEKDGRTLYTYDYADLADINAVLLPVMAALGLSFTACPSIVDEPARFVLDYQLLHVSGEKVAGLYPLPDPARYGPQDLGKAITYARRYALCAVTGLSPGGDDTDAQEVQHGQPAPERKSRQVPDAQLEREGRMTRAQAAAHDRLVKDTRPHERGQVQRGRVQPDDDPWAQDSPVTPERAGALRESEDRPGSMMGAQHRAIELLLTKLGYERSDRDGRRGIIMARLDLEDLESMSKLSAAQAATAIQLLQAELSQGVS